MALGIACGAHTKNLPRKEVIARTAVFMDEWNRVGTFFGARARACKGVDQHARMSFLRRASKWLEELENWLNSCIRGPIDWALWGQLYSRMFSLLEELTTLTAIRHCIWTERMSSLKEEAQRALKAGPKTFRTFVHERLCQNFDSEASIPVHSSANWIAEPGETESLSDEPETGDAKDGSEEPLEKVENGSNTRGLVTEFNSDEPQNIKPILVTGRWRGKSFRALRKIDANETGNGISGDKICLKRLKEYLKRRRKRPDIAETLYLDENDSRIKTTMSYRSMFIEK